MNKLFLGLLLGFFFVACQNTPTSTNKPGDGSAEIIPNSPVMATPEDIQKVDEIIASGLTKMLDLRKQIDALPAQVRKGKETEIEGFYATLEGMIEKQTQMMNEIKASNVAPAEKSDKVQATDDSNSPESVTTVKLMDYKESVGRYNKEAESIQDAISKMGGK